MTYVAESASVFKRRHPRPRLASFDKFFWILVQEFWSDWKQTLMLAVKVGFIYSLSTPQEGSAIARLGHVLNGDRGGDARPLPVSQ
jgi:hypothetical protein